MNERERSEKLEQLADLCRSKGLPMTVQRRAIYEAVMERDDHPTADQICEVVQQRIPNLSRTTVYRVLDTLVDLGVIHRVASCSSVCRYDGNVRRHDHFVCRKCGRMVDFDRTASLPLPKGRPKGFQIDDYSVHYTGICAECRK